MKTVKTGLALSVLLAQVIPATVAFAHGGHASLDEAAHATHHSFEMIALIGLGFGVAFALAIIIKRKWGRS